MRVTYGITKEIHLSQASNRVFYGIAAYSDFSEDDGATWQYSLKLDEVSDPLRNISYPDAVESPDGRILSTDIFNIHGTVRAIMSKMIVSTKPVSSIRR